MEEKIKPTNPLSAPIAIIIAGIIIAGAIYYRPAGPTTNTISPLQAFDINTVPTLAQKSGVNKPAFEQCWQSNKYASKIEAQSKASQDLGGQGTPFPIILTADGRTVVLPGALPFDNLKPALDDLLAGTASSSLFSELPKPLPPVTETDHINGPQQAPLTIIEYSDLDCPYCKVFHDTMNQVKKEYGDQVAWVYRHWPIIARHPNAGRLAEATECVAELGGPTAFWRFLDLSFTAH